MRITTVPAAAAAAALALTLGGCGGDEAAPEAVETSAAPESPDEDTPSGEPSEPRETEEPRNEPVQAGELTEPGATLGVGETATVPFESGSVASTVEITVNEPRIGDIADLAEFDLPEDAKDSVPVYLDALVTNVGDGNLEFSTLGVWGMGSDSSLMQSAILFDTFETCNDESFPADFTNGASHDTCLLFLLPQGVELTGAEYDLPDGDTINWTF